MEKIDFLKKYRIAEQLLEVQFLLEMNHEEISQVFYAFLEAKRTQEEIGCENSELGRILNLIENHQFQLIPSLRKSLT